METERQNAEEFPVRFPGSLSLRDLVMLISVAVSLTIAWSVFGTRQTLAERQLSQLEEMVVTRMDARIKALEDQDRITDQRIRENEFAIDRLYEYLKKPQPTRRQPQ